MRSGRRQVVISCIEAQVCVMQTALGLWERGYEPFLVDDALGSQRAEDRAAGLQRISAAGCSLGHRRVGDFLVAAPRRRRALPRGDADRQGSLSRAAG